MARTDSPFRQQPAPKSKAKAKSKAEERKPDYISQYLAILAHYHKKSSESSSDESNQFVEIETDFKRAYFPGQTVAARVGVPKAALLDNGDGFEEVIVEFKGEIHAFGKAYDGQGSYSFQTDTLFNHKLTLHSNSNSNQDDQSNEKISAKEITSNSSSQASNETSTDLKEWQIKSFLPKEIDLQTEQGLKTLELPTSFKDKFSDPTNFVVYCWKVTGVKKGKFKKSVRKWLPILMPSFAGGPPPDLSVGLQNSNILSNFSPPSYENESSTTSPSSTPQDLNLPSNWTTKKISHKVKKAGLFEREIIDITFMMPEPKFVTNSPLPFVFKIDVSCKDQKEFGEGGNVRLPKLPFEDGRIYGEDEEEEWIPSFDLRRVDDSQAITEAAGFNANDQSASLLSCQISWNQSHLSKEKQEQLQRNGGSSETVNQVSANNSTDASAEPSITSSQSTVDVQNQDGNGTRNVDPFEKFNIGQDWSEPLLVQPVQNQDQTNGGGSKLFKSKGPQSRWVRTAIVSGKISANVVPILQTPNLRTQYILSLYYGIPSLVTTIQEDVCSWIPSSGISNSMLSVLNNADVIRRIAGPNLGLLMNAARDGQSGREVGRNRQPEMGGMNDSTSEFGYGDSRDTFGTFTRSEGDEDEKVAH